MFSFAAPRKPRRPSLTPMIDVVFLLLVFFMLAARFGPQAGLDLRLAGGGAYSGPPRLVDVTPDGLRLNGVALDAGALPGALTRLSESTADTVVIRPREGADLQRLVDVMGQLRAAGFTALALVE
ncbi:ExbD/TolR family protein [Actibacterium sp. D379-3]